MSAGLIVFIVVLAGNVLALILDAMLRWVWRVPTISQRVWARPVLGVPLVLWQVLGAAGLAWHLF